MGDTSRLYTLIYKMRSLFRTKGDEIVGINVTREDIDRGLSPYNVILGDGVSKIVVSPTPPVDPQPGDIWIDIS